MKRALPVVLMLALLASGCSLINGFDDYEFTGGKSDGKDGGSAGAGAGAGGSDGGVDSAVPEAGSGGGGHGGMGGSDGGLMKDGGSMTGKDGGSDLDAGMDAATPDTSVGPECTTAPDCGDVLALDCINNACVPRRVASGVWMSGGGGLVQTPTAKLRVSIGAPVPMGKASSATFRVTVGPGAGRP